MGAAMLVVGGFFGFTFAGAALGGAGVSITGAATASGSDGCFEMGESVGVEVTPSEPVVSVVGAAAFCAFGDVGWWRGLEVSGEEAAGGGTGFLAAVMAAISLDDRRLGRSRIEFDRISA